MNEAETNDDADLAAADLESMKATADRLGITYHPSIGSEKLSEKIKAKLAESDPPASNEAPAAPAEESRAVRTNRLREAATALVRVRVTCMNPAKKGIDGEIFTAGNNVVGTIKKYVPFNVDAGWHVPQIILNMIRARKCQIFVSERTKQGVTFKKAKMINEFSVEELPPLTEAELKELGQRQAMASGA